MILKGKEMAPQVELKSNIRKLIPWLKQAYCFGRVLEEGVVRSVRYWTSDPSPLPR